MSCPKGVAPKLWRRLRSGLGKAIGDFNLINEGDRICVGISGGKDSLAMLMLLKQLQDCAPIRYELVPVTIDAGFPNFDTANVRSFVKLLGLELVVEHPRHADLITAKLRPGSSCCSFCARLKRGALYGAARRLDCNLLALGHHCDDFIETLLLNQFFIGTIKAMSPKMLCDSGDITVIRPMVYLAENDIKTAVQQAGIKTVACTCPVADADHQRQRMKRLLKELEQEIPQIKNSLLAALGNVQLRHLLDQQAGSRYEAMQKEAKL
jgi:tRNA 2-thiocytidine biosynthesis protein TtcA